MRQLLIPVTMAKINTRNNRGWQGFGNQELSYAVGKNANWCRHSGKYDEGSSKVINRTNL